MSCFLRRLLVAFAIANTFLNVVMFILIILPRERTRRIRHTLARLAMAGWAGTARVWTMVHEDLWQGGNGHG
ncbi:MAG TPA: hypothetical protein VGD99_21760 [Anaerolineae bacterium]|jgi:hypothetical protein